MSERIEIEYTDGTKEFLTLPTEEELQAEHEFVENFMKMFADMGTPFEIPEVEL